MQLITSKDYLNLLFISTLISLIILPIRLQSLNKFLEVKRKHWLHFTMFQLTNALFLYSCALHKWHLETLSDHYITFHYFLGRCQCLGASHTQYLQRLNGLHHLLAHLCHYGGATLCRKIFQGKPDKHISR